MLVLSRKPGESIRIGNDILITVTEVRGGRVKIGINAPDACTIRRGELEDWAEATEAAANAEPATKRAPLTASKANAARRQKASASSSDRQQKVAHNRIRLVMETPASPLSVR